MRVDLKSPDPRQSICPENQFLSTDHSFSPCNDGDWFFHHHNDDCAVPLHSECDYYIHHHGDDDHHHDGDRGQVWGTPGEPH